MSANEILSDDGYRADGRRSEELRRLVCRMGHIANADGSAYLEQGNTKVLASVFGPHAIKSKHERIQDEISRQLKQTFEAAIFTDLNFESQIDIYIEVLQSDGSNYSVSVNAATIALLDAGIPMKDYVFSCVCTLVDNTVLIDSNHLEESSHNPELTISILPQDEMIAYLQVSSRLHADQLPRMIKESIQGCHDIKRTIDQFIKNGLINATDY